MNHIELQKRLGSKIKALRSKKNMTQNELAIECDFEKASMSRIESGQTNPTIRTLYKISKALDIPITEFFKD
ncbi:helix-turn-helix domain-containing protein [Ferruginibacter lapsinanis]|uniref:helix-turn-helix domain-containing protein n=1 Tax=Ferruginibacter lapsinanis TaxID=563172 RepID=UPI001E4F3DCE|nr:helix-turn-helix transcriptional regulator [Ferruginibacter lapsinanis]UEG51230.1 helix-turn-helix domain-containing protein [Ferruginibacter lapsinanis]